MDWHDQGIVLSSRSYGESGAIVELFTRDHGRHMGLLRGGAGRRYASMLQPGNTVTAHWRARLNEHLGAYTVELLKPRAGVLMDDAFALTGLSAACSVAAILPERETHAGLFEAFSFLLDTMEDADIWPAIFVRWELGLLQELGFGLDLAQCAATGVRDDLAYVSPRSGGAVSRTAGAPYADRLFRLPPFLVGSQAGIGDPDDIAEGLKITGHFLERHFYAPLDRHLPDARIRLMQRLAARIA
ncbi:MAG: DNA repair protein RecO [Parvibaculum sp.]|nr:DNA repair protein RecO [Parvibaculum sp.]